MNRDTEENDMAKEDRQRIVLEFMDEHSLALPPTYIFRNLKLRRGIPFSQRTVQRALNELVQKGYLNKVDPSGLDDGEIKSAGESTRGAYIITEEGRKYLDD